MKGLDVSQKEFCTLFGLAEATVDEWVEEGMPVVTDDGSGDGDESPPFDFVPSACSKRDVARVFATTPAEIDKWVRQGCPAVPSGKGRSPLIFDLPKVFRWYHVWKSPNRTAAEKDVKIWDLQLGLERLLRLLVERGLVKMD